MRIAAMATMAVLTGMAAQAKGPVQMDDPMRVSIDWHGVRGCPSQAIVVGMNSAAPATFKPGALACSQLFEGIHIVVLYNRIEHRAGEGPVAPVLAHVLVHEITHMLQGLDRHSASGIMKATWRFADFRQMGVRPLPFTADDIELIRLGLEKRACQPAEIRSEGVLVAAR